MQPLTNRGTLRNRLTGDHERLDALLASCLESIDMAKYHEFRSGLLRHIAIEEKVLFPVLRAQRGQTPLEEQLHRDHAALAALLVPPPSADGLRTISAILSAHNPLEEDAGGLYELVEECAGAKLEELLAAAAAVPEVRVVPNIDTPIVRASIAQLVPLSSAGRAGRE